MYIWGRTAITITSSTMAQTTVFYLPDERGNTAMRLDRNGVILSAHVTDAFGATKTSDYVGSSSDDPFAGFGGSLGYMRESGLDLYRCGLRFYDVANARWLTRDPIGYDGGQNLYGYVSGNPVMGADPFGTQDQTNSVTNASGMRTQLSILRETDSTPIRLGDASRIIGITAAQQWWQRWGQWTNQQWQRFGNNLSNIFGGGGSSGGGAPQRLFTSKDPLVAQVANAIESRYPGHVIGVNQKIGGQEIDIVLRNALIEVKQGGAGLTSQVTARLNLGYPVLAYSPKLGGQAIQGINNCGGIGTNDIKLLIDVVKP